MNIQVRVVGVGCGGVNTVTAMSGRRPFEEVRFIAVDTEEGKIREAKADRKIQIGKKLTRGQGTAGDPEKGRLAAEESTERLRDALQGADLVFVAAGLGGGTGTGAGPVIARLARSMGALTVSVATRPFSWEGRAKAEVARAGVAALREASDALVVIPNDRIVETANTRTPAAECYRLSDGVLYGAVAAIAEVLSPRAVQNIDFADFRRVLQEAGPALFGVGEAGGATRATDAAREALRSPLLENASIQGARRLLVNITGGPDMVVGEMVAATEVIRSAAKSDGYQCFGFVSDEGFRGRMRVTVVAAGLADHPGPAVPTTARALLPDDPRIPAYRRYPSPQVLK